MKNIKWIRVTKKLTQLNVQMKTGISQTMLSRYENGKCFPTIDNLIILADFYNTSVHYLLDLTDVKEPYPRKQK